MLATHESRSRSPGRQARLTHGPNGRWRSKPASRKPSRSATLKAGQTYTLLVTLESGRLQPDDRLTVELSGAGTDRFVKELHAGDPDLYLPYRPARDGQGQAGAREKAERRRFGLTGSRRVEGADTRRLRPRGDRGRAQRLVAQANLLRLGRDVYGTADDVDYLENPSEGKSGLDWFRFEVTDEKPILVYFQLDLLDRDVSANLRVYTVDPKSGRPEPYLHGKDPMEIVHDRERERYSKHISRTFTRGTYYLEVNANHPDYILRTRVLARAPL